jgi:PPM family protein phosphatase
MEFLTIGSATDTGMKRAENQDYHSYYSPEKNSRKGTLLALGDGMGGRTGGALASKIAVEAVIEEYYKDSLHSIPEALERAFQKANEAVLKRGDNDINLKGMATTLTAVVVKEDKLYYAHVGDSRGYFIHRDEIRQFTNDHSFVASLVKAGQITQEEAATHPERNIITRAIGLDEKLKVDAPGDYTRVSKGQYILLCCDGLHGVVSDPDIARAVAQYREPDTISKKLVEMANDHGGPDNVTVLVARVDKTGLVSRLANLLR